MTCQIAGIVADLKSGSAFKNPMDSLKDQLSGIKLETPDLSSAVSAIGDTITQQKELVQKQLQSLPMMLPLMKAAQEAESKLAIAKGMIPKLGPTDNFKNSFSAITDSFGLADSMNSSISGAKELASAGEGAIASLKSTVDGAKDSLMGSIDSAKSAFNDSVSNLKAYAFSKFMEIPNPSHVIDVLKKSLGEAACVNNEASKDVQKVMGRSDANIAKIISDAPKANQIIKGNSGSTEDELVNFATKSENAPKPGSTFSFPKKYSSFEAFKSEYMSNMTQIKTEELAAQKASDKAATECAQWMMDNKEWRNEHNNRVTAWKADKTNDFLKQEVDDIMLVMKNSTPYNSITSNNKIIKEKKTLYNKLSSQWETWQTESFINATSGPW